MPSRGSRRTRRSTRAGAGLSWWTPPHHLSPHQRARYTEGCFNLGAAHGVPAVVALLLLLAGCAQDLTYCTGGLLHAETLQLVLLAQREHMGGCASLDKHTPQGNPKRTAKTAMNAIEP